MRHLTAEFPKRVGIVAANNTGYVETMLDCIESGDIAVPLRDDDDHYRIRAANISEVITPTDSQVWMRRSFTPNDCNQPTLISFTSGTEGAPKGVILTHANLADVIRRLNSLMHLDASISEYIGVPVYHSFGFGRCRAVATARGRCFIPSNGFNPSEIGEMLKQGEINAISAVPSLWRVLLANQDAIGRYGSRVRWIEIGSQYMSRQEKEAMKALFPEARIVQHYGLTEASRTTLLEIHETEGDLLESVGQAIGGVEVEQTPEGKIAIRGRHVALSYLINGEEVTLQDDNGWFLTKDLGYLQNGYLFYKGRADDVINCGGIKVAPEALETKVYARIGRSRGLAICRKPDPIRGDGFLVAITKELSIDKQQVQAATLQAIQELGVNAANSITTIDVDSLPTTATGKIQRNQLAEWYALQTSDQEPSLAGVQKPSDSFSIQDIFCRVLNLHEVSPNNSFVSLGGDSLSYIQLSMQLENQLGKLPTKWETMTLAELQKIVPQRKKSTTIETDVLLRAIAIFIVVLNHTTHAEFEFYLLGGSLALLLISGFNFARFQSHKLLQGKVLQSAAPILKSLIIPYLAINLAYQIAKQRIDFSVLLLFNNFIASGAQNVSALPFPFWFVCLLIQIITLFCLLLSVKPWQRFAKSSPWLFGVILLMVGLLVNILNKHLGYPNDLYLPRVPQTLFWVFALGWCINFAKSRAERIVTTGIWLIVSSLITLTWGLTSENIWVLVSGVVLLWVPFIPVPAIAKSAIQTIGSATLYIYMSHMLLITVGHRLGLCNPLTDLMLGLLGSILLWFSFQKLKPFLASVPFLRQTVQA